MTFERGDVVYGADPFKGADRARPWLIISNDAHPYHGEQYIVLALTTKTWHDGLIAIDPGAWIEGSTPEDSSVVPWTVETIEESDVEYWQGTLAGSVVDEASNTFVAYVGPE